MNKREKSTSAYSVQQKNKGGDHSEEVKKNMRVDIGNDSPQRSYDTRVSGHSTPVVKREYIHDIEDSPELDYHCSPISLPCTQDGGNEISWDWHPSSKTSNEKSKPQDSHIETPKRPRQLQKKRNSNSPLLQKPLKRKQVRIEKENIGKLTAELKALTEKMKSIQENCNKHVTGDTDNVIGTEISDDIMIQIVDNDKSKVETIVINNNTKKGSSYEDLFDDSIDDSMVRCSQEIEEKLNLCKSKGNEGVVAAGEKKGNESYYLMSTNSSASSKSINNSKNSSSDMSGQLKTYSNNSSKTNLVSNFSFSSFKNTSLQKGPSKNNIIRTPNKKKQEENMLDFPDDSFDDCLATCVEDDKLLTKLSEYDFNITGCDSSYSKKKETTSLSNKQISNNKQTSSNKQISSNKQTSSNLSETINALYNVKSNSYKNSEFVGDHLVGKFDVITDKESAQPSFLATTSLENRKFFKTKSLSDQCFNPSRNSNSNSKASKTSDSVAPNWNHIPNNCSVSTTYPVITSQNSYKTNGMANVHALDRLKEKEDGNCSMIKYKSTSNLNSIKEVTKESLLVKCTPEEIERKRQEAKMRLEAKRKIQQSGRMANAASEVQIKRSVKR